MPSNDLSFLLNPKTPSSDIFFSFLTNIYDFSLLCGAQNTASKYYNNGAERKRILLWDVLFTRQSVKKGYFVIKSRKCFLFFFLLVFKCSFFDYLLAFFLISIFFSFSSEDISCECQCHMRVMKIKPPTTTTLITEILSSTCKENKLRIKRRRRSCECIAVERFIKRINFECKESGIFFFLLIVHNENKKLSRDFTANDLNWKKYKMNFHSVP